MLIFDYRYVLRRILRRCVRFGTEKLNVPPGFIASLVTVAVDILVSNLTIAQLSVMLLYRNKPCYRCISFVLHRNLFPVSSPLLTHLLCHA